MRRLGAEIRYEELVSDEEPGSMRGGRCRVRGRELVLIDRRLGVLERCATLAEALRSFDLKDVYVPPAVRNLLDARDRGVSQ